MKFTKREAAMKGHAIQQQQKAKRIADFSKQCKECSGPIQYAKRSHAFCSKPCRRANLSKISKIREASRIRSPNICIVCKNETTIYARTVNIFCGKTCKAAFQKEKRLKQFNSGMIAHRKGITKILLSLYERRCSMCELSEWRGAKIALEVDHKDGNAANNLPDNLRLLCPNCHATTPTWKGRNKGNGRKSRGLPLD